MNRPLIVAALLGVALATPVVYGRLERAEPLRPMENPAIPGTDAILVDVLARSCRVSPAQARALALGEECTSEPCAPTQPDTLRCIDDALMRELRQTDPLVGMWAVEAAIHRGHELDAAAGALAVDARAPSPARARALVVLAWTMPRDEAIPRLRAALTLDTPLALAAALELGRLRATEAESDLRALESRLERPADQALVAYSRALLTDPSQAKAQPSGI